MRTLDYRSPGTTGPDGDRIYQWLATRHCLGVAGAVLGIVVGLIIAVGVSWIASGVTSVVVNHSASTPLAIGWPTFWALLLVGTPVLVWRTLRTGGEFYEQQVIESDAFHGKPANYSEWEYRGTVATWSLYGDLFFWGPRLIVDGTRRLCGRDVIRSRSTLRRGTFILSHLLQTTDAVRTKALRFPEEPVESLRQTLYWLDKHDYIGISADGSRVWMSSATRETLYLMLNMTPPQRTRQRSPTRQIPSMDKPETVDTLSAR